MPSPEDLAKIRQMQEARNQALNKPYDVEQPPTIPSARASSEAATINEKAGNPFSSGSRRGLAKGVLDQKKQSR